MRLPQLDKMWSKYPTGTSDEVKRMIGGGVNGAWVTNTCVIRISYCFNYAGYLIPNGVPGLETTFGKDRKRYAFRVAEFKPFLEKTFKRADVSGRSERDVKGKKGVIMFDVEGWSDATGHFDLWDGRKCAGSEYFDKAHRIYLWTC